MSLSDVRSLPVLEGDSRSSNNRSSPTLVQLAPRDPSNLSLVPPNRQGQGLLPLFADRLAQRFLVPPLLRLATVKSRQLLVGR